MVSGMLTDGITAQVVESSVSAVRALPSGGGTNFTAAFHAVRDVLAKYVYSPDQVRYCLVGCLCGLFVVFLFIA